MLDIVPIPDYILMFLTCALSISLARWLLAVPMLLDFYLHRVELDINARIWTTRCDCDVDVYLFFLTSLLGTVLRWRPIITHFFLLSSDSFILKFVAISFLRLSPWSTWIAQSTKVSVLHDYFMMLYLTFVVQVALWESKLVFWPVPETRWVQCRAIFHIFLQNEVCNG